MNRNKLMLELLYNNNETIDCLVATYNIVDNLERQWRPVFIISAANFRTEYGCRGKSKMKVMLPDSRLLVI